MATDYARMSENLRRIYDFTDKVVLYVGAAGRQLLDPSTPFRKLIAIDKDEENLRALRRQIETDGLGERVEVIAADFEDVQLKAEAIYFEFCFHELPDPENALIHAKIIAPDIVVYDHSVGSEWIYFVVEQEKVRRSSQWLEQFGIRRRESFEDVQRFADYDELFNKVAPQGPVAIERIEKFRDAKNIVIPMKYELNLL